MSDIQIILEAATFAAEKHRMQRRKDADASPYINHPLALAHILCSEGAITDADVLAAALLHDTVEDTETSAPELEEKFGPKVAGIVAEVTDDKSLPKEERKRLQVLKAATKSDGAKLVKLADKISNLRDITKCPPADWSTERKASYFRWAKQVVDGLRGVNLPLEKAFDEIYQRGLGLISCSTWPSEEYGEEEDEDVGPLEHPIPERLKTAVIDDLVSRIAEMGRERPEGADDALKVLRALPEIGEDTELEIVWYSTGGPPKAANFHLTSHNLSLTISDEDGSQEIYTCDARCYPCIDSDLEAWLSYFRTLDAPEIAISLWGGNIGAAGSD